MSLRTDARAVIDAALRAADPGANTARILRGLELPGPVTVFAVGKAAIPMAAAAGAVLGDRIRAGLAVTKYGHTGDFSSPYFTVMEAAHPVSDENSAAAARRALAMADALTEADVALVLLSGGGSALLEESAVPASLQREITEKLLARGARIDEINAVRKRLSLVKGGRFAARCYPARVITVALSDVPGDDPQVIASGPTVPDDTPDETVRALLRKYLYDLSAPVPEALLQKPALRIRDGGYFFAGNAQMLLEAAEDAARALGYGTVCLSRALTGEAREQPARLLGMTARQPGKRAYLCVGETTVTLRGKGRGGRNQEMALAAALALEGRDGVLFAAVGSDGTDGPTDAAGGFADGGTCAGIRAAGLDPAAELADNNAYYALLAAGDLLITGPTGTNVNDLTLILTDYHI